ncbi:MAG: acetyl ornithine aminotransferase family protein [Acidobacteria bacterium]|nr:MAG: acetyl ornithine aminotransferase family protein [Acidobacteriota bacterium]
MSDKLPKIVTELPGPRAREVMENDHRYISPSYTRSYPLVAKSARGAIVEDVDGNFFLDFSAGIAVCSTGHCHPDVVRAIQKQAESLIHMSGTDFYYEQMPQLARKLEALMPDGKDWRCFFGNSGTEAIEAAMKLARYATGRWQFIAFQFSFHGRTMGSLSLTSSKAVQRKGFGPLVPGVTHIPYGNASYLEDVVFKTTVNAGEVAAIVVEAIQGEGGYVVPPPEFLPTLEKIARKHGILLIADEVQCGMGRTGKMFGFEHFDFHPDIVAIAKGIASGMPLGVTMAHADVMTWQPGAHASTFGGNPVCLAAALETVRLLQEQYVANSAKMGAFIRPKLEKLMSRHAVISDVRGLGLMIGVEITKDRKTREKAPELRDAIINECFHRGLLILAAGPSTIRLSPPLMVDEEQAQFAVDTLSDAIAAVAK